MQIDKKQIIKKVVALLVLFTIYFLMAKEPNLENFNFYSLLLLYLISLEVINIVLDYIIKVKANSIFRYIIFILAILFVPFILLTLITIGDIFGGSYFTIVVTIIIPFILIPFAIFWSLNQLIGSAKIRVSLLLFILLIIFVLIPTDILHQSVWKVLYYKITGRVIIKHFAVCPNYGDPPIYDKDICLKETPLNCEWDGRWALTYGHKEEKIEKEINCSHVNGGQKQSAIILDCSYGCPK